VELLRDSARDGAVDAGVIGDVEQTSRRLKHLVDDILGIAAVSDTSATADPTSTNIETLVQQEIVRFAFEARDKGVEIDVENGLAGTTVETDPRLLSICLRGLLSNAIKYSREGGRVHVRVDTLVQNGDTLLRTAFTDQGLGMSDETMNTLFQGFRQGEDPMTREHNGIGVGLFMVKRAAELLGGSIQIESEEEKGTTAELTIPVG
jgi:signal transduction histidine kinase